MKNQKFSAEEWKQIRAEEARPLKRMMAGLTGERLIVAEASARGHINTLAKKVKVPEVGLFFVVNGKPFVDGVAYRSAELRGVCALVVQARTCTNKRRKSERTESVSVRTGDDDGCCHRLRFRFNRRHASGCPRRPLFGQLGVRRCRSLGWNSGGVNN